MNRVLQFSSGICNVSPDMAGKLGGASSGAAAFSFTATNPVAKATKGKTGAAGGKPTVRRSTAGTGLRVGVASAVLPTTSEFMDVTGGESAATSFSSGDGLGIHKPGSMTWGGRAATPAPSGRAVDTAKCPAVTRCFSISETSMASEPPPSGSQAPVSASSPVLTGANSISLALHHLHDVSVDAARFDFAHDRPCCERDRAERQHCNYNDLNIKHDCISVIRWDRENTG